MRLIECEQGSDAAPREWIGRRYGWLVILAQHGLSRDRHRLFLCRCDCGSSCLRQSNTLKTSDKTGALQSCGCANRLLQTRHGYHGTRTYASWRAAIYRCHNEGSKDFARYGARGIAVCQAWRDSFAAFLADMGERPAGTSLDRWPDPDGGYEPTNCRWATPTEQGRSRRNAVWVKGSGGERPLGDVADEIGISIGAALMRLKRGKLDGYRPV